MNPQPMCWQTVVLTAIESIITGFLILTVLTTSGYTFDQEFKFIVLILVGMCMMVAVGTGAKWFLDAVLNKIPIGKTTVIDDKSKSTEGGGQ